MTYGAQGAEYVGRRVVVVAGDGDRWAATVVAPLVEAGVEVHVIGAEGARSVPGLASRTACDIAAGDEVRAAIERVGAVIQHLFHCAAGADEAAGVAAAAVAAQPLMVIGGSIVAVREVADAAANGPAQHFVREHAVSFEAVGIRLAVAEPDGALSAGLA